MSIQSKPSTTRVSQSFRFFPLLLIGSLLVASHTLFAQDTMPSKTETAPFRPNFSPLPENINMQSSAGSSTTITPVANNQGTTQPSSQPATTQNNVELPTKIPNNALPGEQSHPSQGQNSPLVSPVRATELLDQTQRELWQRTNPGSGDVGTAPNFATQPEADSSRIPTDITRVSKTFSSLPNDAGQVWREYDILPYTSQITNVDHPEQAIIDWVLQQTGKDMWFRQPLGILSANRDRLVVYHTPEIHNEIKAILDRFVFNKGMVQAIDIRLCTVASPDWRESCYSVMQPIAVQTPGVEAWIVSKENAALLLGQLGRRSDFKAQSGGRVKNHDGQNFVIEKRTPRQFAQSVRWTPGQGVGYQPLLSQVNEGYRLDVSCLNSLDGRTMEASIKCAIDQIEKFSNIRVPIPNSTDRVSNVTLQIPQVVCWRVEERFRWPADQVLLVSCGVVATPDGRMENRPLGGLLETNNGRADALLFLDYRGPEAQVVGSNSDVTARTDLVPLNQR